MSYTGRDLCTDALMDIGVIPATRKASGPELETALRYAQGMIDSQSADRMNLYSVLRSLFPLVSGQQTYTIGASGADFTGNRPNWMPDGVVTPVGTVLELPLRSLTRLEWEGIRDKSVTEIYPRAFYYQPTTDVLGAFKFYGVPQSVAVVTLSIPVPLGTITADAEIVMPPNYREHYRHQLAKRLCRPFRVPRTPDLEKDAFEAEQLIQSNNNPGPPDARVADVTIGSGRGGGFDITTNSYRQQ